jgi:hypothetical protein
MVPATADWSFNRWLMKSRTHLLAVLLTLAVRAGLAVIVVVAAVLAAPVLAAVAVAVPVAATIVIAIAVAVTAVIPPKLAAKSWSRSWFTLTGFQRP